MCRQATNYSPNTHGFYLPTTCRNLLQLWFSTSRDAIFRSEQRASRFGSTGGSWICILCSWRCSLWDEDELPHFLNSSERSTLFYSFEWRLYNFEIFRPKKRHELEECANGAKNLSSYHFESVRSAIELIAQLRRWWNLQTSVQILNRPKAAQILIGLSSEEWTSERKSDQSSCAVAEFVNQIPDSNV